MFSIFISRLRGYEPKSVKRPWFSELWWAANFLEGLQLPVIGFAGAVAIAQIKKKGVDFVSTIKLLVLTISSHIIVGRNN